MARITLSTSPAASWPALCRLPTISRIASSLPVACKSTIIDSRITKSASFIRPSIDRSPGEQSWAWHRNRDAKRGISAGRTADNQPAALRVVATAGKCLVQGPTPDWTSLDRFRSPREERTGRKTGMSPLPRDVAFVLLDLLLVTPQLMLDLVDAQIHRRLGGGPTSRATKSCLCSAETKISTSQACFT